jgi:UDP-N-acetylmuramoyl-tripeptide--D-alanyl-D-alanine ligase
MIAAFRSTIGEIARHSGGILLCGDPGKKVQAISTDSREIPGEGDCFFVPIKGERFDGHDFIMELVLKRKISGFLTERDDFAPSAAEHGVAAVFCDNTLSAYGSIARAHRLTMPAKIIGVTGTNGKTTTKELLASLLSSTYFCHKNEKNFNNEIGVPHALLSLQKEHEYAVIEMGMNHAGEISRLSNIVCPDIAVITNIGEGHLEFLGSVENVARAKSEILDGMKAGSLLFVNAEIAHADVPITKAHERGVEVQTYALTGTADIIPESLSLGTREISITIHGETYRAQLYGIHNASNLLVALVVARRLGVSPEKAKEALERFSPVDKRSEIIERGFTVINDTYNSNPLSAKSALRSIQMIFPHARKIAVLSDMKELGVEAERYHAELGKEVHARGFDVLFTCGEFASDIARGAREAGMDAHNVKHFESKTMLICELAAIVRDGDAVLVKGSRAMKMEEVTDALVRK